MAYTDQINWGEFDLCSPVKVGVGWPLDDDMGGLWWTTLKGRVAFG